MPVFILNDDGIVDILPDRDVDVQIAALLAWLNDLDERNAGLAAMRSVLQAEEE